MDNLNNVLSRIGEPLLLNRLYSHFKQKWPEIIFELIFVMIGAALGVFIGFYANNKSVQIQANKRTSARIHAMYLENNNINIPLALNLIEDHKKQNIFQTRSDRISLEAAKIAFSDDNIHEILPPEQIILIQNYIQLGTSMDWWNQTYLNFAERFNYIIPNDPDHLKPFQMLKNKIVNNAIKFSALGYILQEKLPSYFDRAIYSSEKVRKEKEQIKVQINALKKKILKGEYTRHDKAMD